MDSKLLANELTLYGALNSSIIIWIKQIPPFWIVMTALLAVNKLDVIQSEEEKNDISKCTNGSKNGKW